MSESPSEKHNRLSREFVMMAGTETKSYSELLVVAESTMLATMMLLVKLYGIQPTHASTYLESALHEATKRYSEGER